MRRPTVCSCHGVQVLHVHRRRLIRAFIPTATTNRLQSVYKMLSRVRFKMFSVKSLMRCFPERFHFRS